MRQRLVTRFAQPLLAATLTLPLLLACGGDSDGTGDAVGEQAASRRVRPAAGAEAPVPPPPDMPAVPLVQETAPGESQGQTEAPAPAQPQLAKPTRPRGPAPPAPPRQPFKVATPEELQAAELVPGAPMPESFPRDLPAPSDAQQVAASRGGTGQSSVAYESPRDVQQVLAELEQGYAGAGWEVELASGGEEGLILASKSNLSAMAVITPRDEGGTRIEVITLGTSAR